MTRWLHNVGNPTAASCTPCRQLCALQRPFHYLECPTACGPPVYVTPLFCSVCLVFLSLLVCTSLSFYLSLSLSLSSRAIIIRNEEVIPMSNEFTPESERQRLQYLVLYYIFYVDHLKLSYM